MSQDAFDVKAMQPQAVAHLIKAVGGSSAVTKVHGIGLSVSRTGTGAYRITWAENPGTFIQASVALQADTPGDLAGHTVIFDVYDATNRRLDFIVYNASDAAHDLAASEWFNVVAWFKTVSV